MNRYTTQFAVATLVLAITNAYTCWLLFGRPQALAEVRPDSQRDAELASLEQQRYRLEGELRALLQSAGERPDSTPCGARTEAEPPSVSAPVMAALRAAMSSSSRPPELLFEQLQFMSRRRYGQLFEDLGLAERQVEALLRTLAAQEQRALGSTAQPSDAERARNQAEIAAVIGADEAAHFERLKQTLSARSELRQVRDQLEELGQPLSDDQYRELVSIASTRAPNPPPPFVTGDAPEVGLARLRTWVGERDRRLREDSATVLTPEQLKRLEESESLRTAMSPMPPRALARNHAWAGSGG